MKQITDEKLDKYFEITQTALTMARESEKTDQAKSEEILDMVERYVSDARFFRKKDDFINCFACLNYAHGWLDCGARLQVFLVYDDYYFTVDSKK